MPKFRYAKPAPIKRYGYFPAVILRRKYSGGFRFHCRYGPCVPDWSKPEVEYRSSGLPVKRYKRQRATQVTVGHSRPLSQSRRRRYGRSSEERSQKRWRGSSQEVAEERRTEEEATEAVSGRLFSGRVPADVYRKRWKYWDEKARVPRL